MNKAKLLERQYIYFVYQDVFYFQIIVEKANLLWGLVCYSQS